MRHSDSKLIILIFLQNIDFGFLLVKNLFLFIDPLQIVFFLFLYHLFVLCSHEIVSEFAVVDVDEVNDVDDEHGHADDQCGKGIIEKLGIERHVGVHYLLESADVAVRTVEVHCAFEPVVIRVNREQIG